MQNFLGETAPDFSDPLALLTACHGRMLGLCELLERLPAHQATHGNDDELSAAANRLLRYFDQAAPLHHQDEEQDLLPLLGGRLEPEIRHRLETEHEEQHALWARLRTDLLAAVDGRARPLEAARIHAFVEACRDHIAFEETQVLPLARTALNAEALARLGQAMAARRGLSDRELP